MSSRDLDGAGATHQWLDEVRAEAAEKKLDFYKLVVSKNVGIRYQDVTKAQREAVKSALFGFTYGQHPGGAAVNLKKPAVKDQTEGWQSVIRKAGEEGRAREAMRLKQSLAIRAMSRSLTGSARLRALLEAHDHGPVRTDELLDELRALSNEPF